MIAIEADSAAEATTHAVSQTARSTATQPRNYLVARLETLQPTGTLCRSSHPNPKRLRYLRSRSASFGDFLRVRETPYSRRPASESVFD